MLMHCIERFYQYDPQIEIIITLPENWVDHWHDLCTEYNFQIVHRVVTGGEKRYHSVKNAINHAKGDLIAIHDGVRPLVQNETIQRCFESAQILKAAVPAIEQDLPLRVKTEEGSQKINRESLVHTQTPQVFQRGILIRAYKQDYHPSFTDDAAVVENMGVAIHIVEGNEENIRIITNKELKFAEAVLEDWSA